VGRTLSGGSADDRAAWDARLTGLRRPRIGLVWSGNADHHRAAERSIALNALSPLLDVNASFVSVQKDVRAADAAEMAAHDDDLDVGLALADFAEAAALLSQLDLLITVDTSVAHLAGALGQPVWLMLPYIPDWSWLLDRDSSPWYPSARLFRQDETRTWGHVVEHIRVAWHNGLKAEVKNVQSARERQVLDWLAGQRGAMEALLRQLVNIDSGSRDKAGVDRVGKTICDFLAAHDVEFELIPNDTYGDAIRATVPAPGERTILLMGHRDTVFPQGEARRRPFTVEGARGLGPGAADMKAGLVMNSFVAAALRKYGGAPAPLVMLYTADEEIGSPSSRVLIEMEARRARMVFNAEPGRPDNAVITGRKAGVFMRFEVSGRAAHAGANFEDGASAIFEIAHKIVALSALTDQAKGITVNVGLVFGGQTVNMVAPKAAGEMDLRYVAPGDRDATLRKIEAIMTQSTVPGTSATYKIYAEFLPLVQTPESERLFEHYVACGRANGQKVTGQFTGGCADSGFSAAVGAPTLCAVGPIGGRAHSPDEYVELNSIVPRAQVLALAIMRSGQLS
jgi:glutamate carboxypeptidase